MSTAASTALRMPEILSIIFENCVHIGSYGDTDTPTLASCMRVNKSWAEEAAAFLWYRCGKDHYSNSQKIPGIFHLAALAPNSDRLQWYARLVRELYPPTNYSTEHYYTALVQETFKHTEFPCLQRLECIDYWGLDNHIITFLPQCLRPSLKTLTLSPMYLSDELFTRAKV